MSKNEPVANSYSANTKCCGPEMVTLMEENKMIRKGLIYLTTTLMILLLVSLAMAVIPPPPPPANQNIGLYDTVFTGFTTAECKNVACHGDENIPDRHHLLIDSEGKKCLDCHSLTGGTFDPFRDCSDCHLTSPHHATDDAQNYQCSECHGSLVDDYDDGHVIPTYSKTLITPDTSFKDIDETSGLKVGGCEACHEPDPSADPAIESNPNTHHNLTYFSENNCAFCHVSEGVTLDIRLCEKCHGVKSLHNIQYDYDNTVGELGYGHIGENWDCYGCHGWNVSKVSIQGESTAITSSSGEDLLPLLDGMGVTVPRIVSVDPCEVIQGQQTVIRITGTDFTNVDNNGVLHTSIVVLENGTEILPDSITATEIVITFSAEDIGQGNYGLWVVKSGDVKSNKKSLAVLPGQAAFVVITR